MTSAPQAAQEAVEPVQWVRRWNYWLSSSAVLPGVYAVREGGYFVRARVRDPDRANLRTVAKRLRCATAVEAAAALFNLKQAKRRRPTYVYFIADESNGAVKIGTCTGDPFRRLRTLQTGHPAALELLFYLKGGRDLERELHQRFAGLRRRGEWFTRGPEIDQYAVQMAQEGKFIAPARRFVRGPGGQV